MALRSTPLVLVLPLLLLLLAAPRRGGEPLAPQAGTVQEGDEETIPDDIVPALLRHRKEQRDALIEGLRGAWRLVHHRQQDQRSALLGWEEGLFLFGDGFLTVQLRGVAFDSVLFIEVPAVLSGVHQYRVDEFRRLQLSSIIGHSSFGRELDFEPTGSLREYEASIELDELTLRRQDGVVFVFERMAVEGAFPEDALQQLNFRRQPDGTILERD